MELVKRIEYIDIAKGLGILLVVIGHCISMKSFMGRFIYTFHMPLFFFLAGICFNECRYSVAQFLKKRFRQIIVPCIIFTLLICSGSELLFHDHTFAKLSKELPETLWFMPVLFLTGVSYLFISKIARYGWMRIIIILLLSYLGCYLYRHNIRLPYSISAIPSAIFYYGAGNLLKDRINHDYRWDKAINMVVPMVAFSIIALLVAYTRIKSDMHYNVMREPFLNYLSALLGIAGIVSLSKLIAESGKKELKSTSLFLGVNSLVIMVFHFFFLNISKWFVKPPFMNFEMIQLYYITEQFVMWIPVLIIVWLINEKISWIIAK